MNWYILPHIHSVNVICNENIIYSQWFFKQNELLCLGSWNNLFFFCGARILRCNMMYFLALMLLQGKLKDKFSCKLVFCIYLIDLSTSHQFFFSAWEVACPWLKAPAAQKNCQGHQKPKWWCQCMPTLAHLLRRASRMWTPSTNW